MFGKQMIKLMPDNNKGFSLIEVLFAIVILSIGILAMSALQVISIDNNSASGNQLSGITWAGDRIERLMALNYSDPDLDDDDNDGIGGLNDATAGTADGTDTQEDAYSIFWNVAVDSPIDNTKTVTVIVSSQGRHGQTVSLNFIKPDII